MNKTSMNRTNVIKTSANETNAQVKIVALTDAGHKLALLLEASICQSEVWFKPKPFKESVQQAFMSGHRLIMICATGIVMRTLAPVLNDKHTDPAVLVLDEQGKFVIPLLSGHEGGANDWGQTISDVLEGQFSTQLVVTTAKPYLKPIYTAGLGCERNCPESFLQDVLLQCLSKANLTLADIHSFNSIDIKSDEVALMKMGQDLNMPFETFSKDLLGKMESKLSTRSDYVFNTVGVYGVAESAALFGAFKITGQESELVVEKIKNTKATCAIARSFPSFAE